MADTPGKIRLYPKRREMRNKKPNVDNFIVHQVEDKFITVQSQLIFPLFYT